MIVEYLLRAPYLRGRHVSFAAREAPLYQLTTITVM